MLKFVGRAVAGFRSFLRLVRRRGRPDVGGRAIPCRAGTMVDIGEGRAAAPGLRRPKAGPAIARWSGWRPGPRLRRRLGRDAQEALSAAGWRSCAYDRAGMGFSPPGPAPRDGLAIVSDFEKLVRRLGREGAVHPGGPLDGRPAPARIRRSQPGQDGGAGAGRRRHGRRLRRPRPSSRSSRRFSDRVALGGARGVDRALQAADLHQPGRQDRPAAGRQGREALGLRQRSPPTAPPRAEVALWSQAAEQATAVPAYDPKWPVAVVTAGAGQGTRRSARPCRPRRPSGSEAWLCGSCGGGEPYAAAGGSSSPGISSRWWRSSGK